MVIEIPGIAHPVPLVPLVAGAVLLLFGWLLYRAALLVAGGVLGAAIGLGCALLAVQAGGWEGTEATIAQAIGAGAGALAGILLFRFFEAFAFFATGCAVGAWAFLEGFRLARAAGAEWAASEALFAFGLPLAAVLSGVLTAWLRSYLVAIASAAAGTLLIMGALEWPLGGWIAVPVFVIGAAAQASLIRPQGAEDDEDD